MIPQYRIFRIVGDHYGYEPRDGWARLAPALYQVNVVVPNLTAGTYPVQVSVNGVVSVAAPALIV